MQSNELMAIKELAKSVNDQREIIYRAEKCSKKTLVAMLSECGIVASKRATKKVLVNVLASAVIRAAAVGNLDSRRFLS